MRIPPKLKPGNEIRVLALSRSLGGAMQLYGFTESDVQFATSRLESLGLMVSFGRWARECNAHLTASPQHRLEDFEEAIANPSVKAILAVVGGIGAIQILDGIDYEEIRSHPKIICGYSDIGTGLNLLQGSGYFPPLQEAVLFLEQNADGKATLMELDTGLRALSFQPEFPNVRAIVIGRFAKSGRMTRENLTALISEIPALHQLPVIGNCDFGHMTPILTLPIGGRCQLQVSKGKASITVTEH